MHYTVVGVRCVKYSPRKMKKMFCDILFFFSGEGCNGLKELLLLFIYFFLLVQIVIVVNLH